MAVSRCDCCGAFHTAFLRCLVADELEIVLEIELGSGISLLWCKVHDQAVFDGWA